jgi:hypothetical protein
MDMRVSKPTSGKKGEGRERGEEVFHPSSFSCAYPLIYHPFSHILNLPPSTCSPALLGRQE